MSDALLQDVLRFPHRLKLCAAPEEVVAELHALVSPAANVIGLWFLPRDVKQNSRRRYRVYAMPGMPTRFVEEYWTLYDQHGMSFFGRCAGQVGRDVLLSEAVRAMKPKPHELWIMRLCHHHGIREAMYCMSIRDWRGLYWWPKRVHLDEDIRMALRFAGDAAVRRIAEIVGPHDGTEEDPRLTEKERETLRLLRGDLTERQAAKELGVELSTVKKMVARCKRKLGTSSLREAIAEAVRYYVVLTLAGTLACGGMCEEFGPDDPVKEQSKGQQT